MPQFNCSQISDLSVICGNTTYVLASSVQNNSIQVGSWIFWVYLCVSIFLILFAGIVSGLTIGLLSVDMMNLEIFQRSGTPKEKKYAERIIPLVKNQNLLLVTLLLASALANESLPVLLDRISTSYIAIIVSVISVLLVGEIIPQGLCKKFGLAIGANLSWLVRILTFILFPISFPISKLLDKILGTNPHLNKFERTELMELLNMHSTINQGPLSIDETTIITGALNLKNKTAKDCMTSLDKVFMFDINTPMSVDIIEQIKLQGHSRIPIYENDRQNVKGILLVKSLLGTDFEKINTIKDLELRELPSCSTNSDLYELLNQFQEGKSHMSLVKVPETQTIIGIVTLEDIIEELIQEEILDEQDLALEYRKKVQNLSLEAQNYLKGLAINHQELMDLENQKKSPKHRRVYSSPLNVHKDSKEYNPIPPINSNE